jgi:hypothetical protein
VAPVKEILQFRVTLAEVRPMVWRRIQVPADYTLARLHKVIQAATGWEDYHLHKFTIADIPYGDIDTDEEDRVRDERAFRLRDFTLATGNRIDYEYDFGDCWRHVLELEDRQSAVAGTVYPHCAGGECSAPPEDVGGVSGYDEFLEALLDPGDEEHEHIKPWVGQPFDPTAFSINGANERLRKKLRLAQRSSDKP